MKQIHTITNDLYSYQIYPTNTVSIGYSGCENHSFAAKYNSSVSSRSKTGSKYESSETDYRYESQKLYVKNRKKPKKTPGKRGRSVKWLLFLIAAALICKVILSFGFFGETDADDLRSVSIPDWIDTQLIGIDGASRRGTDLDSLKGIVIHYVGNPGTTAQANRNYFDSSDSNVSAHFVIGLDGEIIQCIPLWEISSASNHRNSDTISIEVCHPDASGKFNDTTYQSLVRLTAWLCSIGHLSSDDVIRHYDVTGKLCPLYYVEHEDAWIKLKKDIAKAL